MPVPQADFELYQQAFMETSLGEPPERSGPISWELARDALLLFYVEHRVADLTRMENLVMYWGGNAPEIGGWPVGQQLDKLLQ